ncbi:MULTISPECIES: DUF2637 domain-containing protein [unclassified Streptomyces]|uniref:DUF2637 domain-containing protein n=1 Tax=unclassified Streptomyces TaxID=2593676 RepID=UPI001BE63F81|nr:MULTISPECIES: DUF2637 domain-containing protein [unclassified Streptomyces]MBT2404568.1 DUF2637 domain-containing protein [Streptomyces sp. ISL-21]MBT2612135.1 DUF2637 domain-containing protein [Streptomyces sp. ISL-87]
MAQLQLTRTHRILIGVVVAGAVVIAGIGFAGSYAAVRALAVQKGFGNFSLVFPIGIDAGICVLLALDLLLTWIRIPFPLLRQTAWLLTIATIAFNGAAAWPDPLGVGMHAVIPILFVVTVEAARHAVGRIADITADRHMEGVRITRWLLSPIPTFKLWRRMKLWELRSYEQAVGMEQDRLIYQARLQARYGRGWRRKAPVEALMPLRLARIGVPLAQTASAGLTAAGLSPVLLSRPEPAHVPEPAAEPELMAAAEVPELPPATQPLVEDAPAPEAESPSDALDATPEAWDAMPEPILVDLAQAGRDFVAQYGAVPSAEQFAAYLARDYGLTDQDTGGLLPDAQLEPVLAELRAAELEAAAHAASVPAVEAPVTDAPAAPAPAHEEQPAGAGEPHPFFGEQGGLHSLSEPSVEPARLPAGAVPAPTASVTDARQAAPAGRSFEQPVLAAPAGAEGQDWVAEVIANGEATARVPRQQTDEEPAEADPIQREIELVASWLMEAEETGKRLSGAEVARRLEVSPKTGQRRVLDAQKYLEEQRRQQGRAHLRSVGSS